MLYFKLKENSHEKKKKTTYLCKTKYEILSHSDITRDFIWCTQKSVL